MASDLIEGFSPLKEMVKPYINKYSLCDDEVTAAIEASIFNCYEQISIIDRELMTNTDINYGDHNLSTEGTYGTATQEAYIKQWRLLRDLMAALELAKNGDFLPFFNVLKTLRTQLYDPCIDGYGSSPYVNMEVYNSILTKRYGGPNLLKVLSKQGIIKQEHYDNWQLGLDICNETTSTVSEGAPNYSKDGKMMVMNDDSILNKATDKMLSDEEERQALINNGSPHNTDIRNQLYHAILLETGCDEQFQYNCLVKATGEFLENTGLTEEQYSLITELAERVRYGVTRPTDALKLIDAYGLNVSKVIETAKQYCNGKDTNAPKDKNGDKIPADILYKELDDFAQETCGTKQNIQTILESSEGQDAQAGLSGYAMANATSMSNSSRHGKKTNENTL